MKFYHFGNNLLSHIKEKSDDIEKVMIFEHGCAILDRGLPVTFHEPIMVIFFMSGMTYFLKSEDYERVLDDGILERMRIPIEIDSQFN